MLCTCTAAVLAVTTIFGGSLHTKVDVKAAKGKADEGKSWTDVLGEDAGGEKSIEEMK